MIALLKTAVEIGKILKDSLKIMKDLSGKTGQPQIDQNILSVLNELNEAKRKIVGMENEIKKLQATARLRKLIKREQNVYVPKLNEIEDYGSGPWCTNCFDVEENLVNLHRQVLSSSGDQSGNIYHQTWGWVCPHCNKKIVIN